MATLSANAVRTFYKNDEDEYPVVATDIIYEGAALGDNASGYVRPLVAGDPFRGFALEKADNSAGSAGDVSVRARLSGRVKLAVASLVITDVGKTVYASDDATFTLTASTNSPIGRVEKFISSGVGVVKFSVAERSLGDPAATLTDNSGGTASATIAAIGATYDQAEVRNAIASLASAVNAIDAKLAV